MEEICGAGRVSCRFTHVYPDGPAPYFTVVEPARRGAWALAVTVSLALGSVQSARIPQAHADSTADEADARVLVGPQRLAARVAVARVPVRLGTATTVVRRTARITICSTELYIIDTYVSRY